MSQPPSYATLDVAIAAALASLSSVTIAFVQWRLARRKLKLDLFDKRFEVFRVTTFLADSLLAGDNKRELEGLSRAYMSASFLFPPAVSEFIKELFRLGTDMAINNKMQKQANEARNHEAILAASQKEMDHHQRLMELSEKIDGMFRPYLDFSHVQ